MSLVANIREILDYDELNHPVSRRRVNHPRGLFTHAILVKKRKIIKEVNETKQWRPRPLEEDLPFVE